MLNLGDELQAFRDKVTSDGIGIEEKLNYPHTCIREAPEKVFHGDMTYSRIIPLEKRILLDDQLEFYFTEGDGQVVLKQLQQLNRDLKGLNAKLQQAKNDLVGSFTDSETSDSSSGLHDDADGAAI